MDDSTIICDEVIDSYVNLSLKDDKKNKFWWKNITCKTQKFYILLAFLLVAIAILIAASIY